MTLLKSTGCFLFILMTYLSFGQNSRSKVSIELSIPHTQEFAHINNCSSLKKTSVIIHNNTDSIHYFYEDWNSYGYYNITFEIKAKDSIYEIVRPRKYWYRNYKSHFILNPNESVVFPYLLVDTACSNKLFENRVFEDGWIGFPSISDTVEIRAIYQLCDLNDTITDEWISRLNYGRDFYIDFLDDDIKVELGLNEKSKQEPKTNEKVKIIFHEPLVSSWQRVILRH
ncbi:hypothetical protein [Fluviicola taffensis]|uniref:hypothetical protein n=1 Tax=Fluviicola taffensis TaxID=191579 RepID=UPI003137B447